MTASLRIAAPFAALFAVLLGGCGGCGGGDRATGGAHGHARPVVPSERVDPRGCDRSVRALDPRVQRGISYVHAYDRGGERGYGSAASRQSLRELRALGADWVSLMPFGFQTSLEANHVTIIGRNSSPGETDARMRREIAQAHDAGMHVLLKPHIWIRSGEWIGQANPGSEAAWQTWLTSYRELVLHYAGLAAETRVEVLAIGVELRATERRDAWWRALARDVRAVYSGKLVYCANWDDVPRIGWWDAVDYIGAQFYAPIARNMDTSTADMSVMLARQLDAIGAVAQRSGRPVIFTEVGYKSVTGTGIRPHEWPEQIAGHARTVNDVDQLRAWRVFLTGIRDRTWVEGLYVWKWFTDPDTTEEGPIGFSPRGKPAEASLRAAFRGRCP